MFSKLHDRLGTAGLVVAIVALIAALSGSAYAAQRFVTKHEATKIAKREATKIGKREAKKFAKAGAQGPAGQAGAAGPAGPAGSKGDKGDPGTAGGAGAPGKSVVVGNLNVGQGGCSEGGVSVEVEGSGSKKSVCNGEEGQPGEPWTAGGVLPVGSTETGTWADTVEGETATAFSFNVPLGKKPTEAIVVPIGGTNANCDNGTGEAPSASNPEADPGFVCVFVGYDEAGAASVEVTFNPAEGPSAGAGQTSKNGLGLYLGAATFSFISGSYAVTAGA